MKAWLMDSLDGGIEKLRLGEAPDPTPGPGEALLRVRWAALNPADRYMTEGQYPAHPPMPHILGRDGAGEIVRLGPGVTGLSVGQSVVVLRSGPGVDRPGTFAQFLTAPAEVLAPIPAGWSGPEAAAGPLVYLTAYQALTQWGELVSTVVLITGASGGVGVAAVQLARAMGHTVVALSRSESKRQQLLKIGADHALDPQDANWRDTLKELLTGRRVGLAINAVGGPMFNDVLATLDMWGKVSVVGRLAGPVPQFNTASLFFRRARIGGVAVGTYSTAESRSAWEQILRLLGKSDAKPLIDRIFPFEKLPEAFARLAEGPMGKVVLEVAGES